MEQLGPDQLKKEKPWSKRVAVIAAHCLEVEGDVSQVMECNCSLCSWKG